MYTGNKTDKEILDELEKIYKRIAEDLNELSKTEPQEQPGKNPSPLFFHGIIFLAICLFLGIFLTVIVRLSGPPDISPPAKTPTYKISITIPPASSEADTEAPSEMNEVVAVIQDKKEVTPPALAPLKKEVSEEKKEDIPATVQEKMYTIQISAIRNLEIAKDFLKEIEVSLSDVHWDKLDSKKYGVWYRIFAGHFASRTEALKYMKDKDIRNTHPGSYIVKIPAAASPPKK